MSDPECPDWEEWKDTGKPACAACREARATARGPNGDPLCSGCLGLVTGILDAIDAAPGKILGYVPPRRAAA